MENFEFSSCSDGTVVARTKLGTKVVTQYDRDIITFVYDEVKNNYPAAYIRLCNLYDRYKNNKVYFEYLVAKRFIRCNMGADDLLSMDVEGGIVNLEFINCPLRGECKDEKIICCPSRQTKLTKAQESVAKLYAIGKGPKEIADILGKSSKTVSNHLREIKSVLHLKRVRDIITYNIIYKL